MFLILTAMAAVPVTDDALLRYGEEERVFLQELPVQSRIEVAGVPPYLVRYLDHVLPRKLNHERRNPLVIGADDILQMLLADKTTMVPCQQAVQQFHLQWRKVRRIDQSGIMIYPIRNKYG